MLYSSEISRGKIENTLVSHEFHTAKAFSKGSLKPFSILVSFCTSNRYCAETISIRNYFVISRGDDKPLLLAD